VEALLQEFRYDFAQDNPFVKSPTPFTDALQLYKDGDLSDAILAFEATVLREPTNVEAWRWLGTAHAENDEDKMAIASLLRAVHASPEDLDALLDLGVSFTNELAQSNALNFLTLWIEKHPQYSRISKAITIDEHDRGHFGFQSLHRKVSDMFMMATELNSNDADVHTVLGVLYNLSREFEKAEHHFNRAVELSPENYSLWNKLGATQANSSRNEGSKIAVSAYRRALELKPNYVRAWVNMGISYANQAKYKTSAKYYLKALSQNERADHIWAYLRIAFTCMEREDLIRKAEQRDPKLFLDEFPL
jgi:peroxin-5